MDEKQEVIKAILQELLSHMGVQAEIEIRFLEETVIFNLHTSDSAVLIGQYGAHLSALQYLARLLAYKRLAEPQKFVVDVEDYKKNREEFLRQLPPPAAAPPP